MLDVRRREVLTLLGGAAAVWPLTARAQQPDRIPRIGVLMGVVESLAVYRANLGALREGLQALGWTDGRNVRIDTRWAAPGNVEALQLGAKELVAMQPDLILSHTTPTTATLLGQTRSIPIIFVFVTDPHLRALPGHPEPTVSWHIGFRGRSPMLDLRRRAFVTLLGSAQLSCRARG
jgi:putative tryptophan/tyrosine transport system substrate-binding protein